MASMGIPTVYGIDNNHGTSYVDGGTLFPQPLNQAASFNSEIPFRACEICSYETRAASIPWIYTPTLDLARGSSWPRMWESYGEDPLVNAVMGAQAVRGCQGNDPNDLANTAFRESLAESLVLDFCYRNTVRNDISAYVRELGGDPNNFYAPPIDTEAVRQDLLDHRLQAAADGAEVRTTEAYRNLDTAAFCAALDRSREALEK